MDGFRGLKGVRGGHLCVETGALGCQRFDLALMPKVRLTGLLVLTRQKGALPGNALSLGLGMRKGLLVLGQSRSGLLGLAACLVACGEQLTRLLIMSGEFCFAAMGSGQSCEVCLMRRALRIKRLRPCHKACERIACLFCLPYSPIGLLLGL